MQAPVLLGWALVPVRYGNQPMSRILDIKRPPVGSSLALLLARIHQVSGLRGERLPKTHTTHAHTVLLEIMIGSKRLLVSRAPSYSIFCAILLPYAGSVFAASHTIAGLVRRPSQSFLDSPRIQHIEICGRKAAKPEAYYQLYAKVSPHQLPSSQPPKTYLYLMTAPPLRCQHGA